MGAIYDALGEEGLHKSYEPQKSPAEKLHIVEDVLNNKLSLNAATVKHLISSVTIKSWIKSISESIKLPIGKFFNRNRQDIYHWCMS